MILRDIGSLAAARRHRRLFEFEKADRAATDAAEAGQAARAPAAADPAAGDDKDDKKDEKDAARKPVDVATGLEALRAVLPATFITLYSTAALFFQNFSQSAGAPGRAAVQAGLANHYGQNQEGLKLALQGLTVETTDYVAVRVFIAALSAVVLAVWAYKKAQVPDQPKHVLMEPAVTTLAFVAWALGAPGTVLASYLNANDLAMTTGTIVFSGAIALWGVSSLVLTQSKET